MDVFYFIGVDVSKKKLDLCVMFQGKVIREDVVGNQSTAISKWIKRLKKDFNIESDDFLVCAEHTGQYSYPLVCACKTLECKLWLENPAQIKYCSGMQRGKNDKVDARRIAVYASRFNDKAKYYNQPIETIQCLSQLESERSLYTIDISKYKAQLSDQKDYMSKDIYDKKAKRLRKLINELQAAVEIIQKEMEYLISGSECLSRQMELLTSVDGVGKVVALNMIIATEAFTRFDNPRKFCCHAGVAPFAYTSGSSQHSKNAVSNRANKDLKRLLHLAAVAIVHKKDCELKTYYERKVAEGKNKMLVINALRAKIVSRMFAVIKRDELYTPIYS